MGRDCWYVLEDSAKADEGGRGETLEIALDPLGRVLWTGDEMGERTPGGGGERARSLRAVSEDKSSRGREVDTLPVGCLDTVRSPWPKLTRIELWRMWWSSRVQVNASPAVAGRLSRRWPESGETSRKFIPAAVLLLHSAGSGLSYSSHPRVRRYLRVCWLLFYHSDYKTSIMPQVESSTQ
jgi:hypothetical protein